jgi:hypothetical protein
MHSNPVSLLASIYAKDAQRLASFYETALNLERIDAAPGFVLLASKQFQLAIIQAPEQIASTIEIATPPKARASTPIKLSFLVPDIESLRPGILAAGGSLKEPNEAWQWRGEKHLDGLDPEGNVFQLRQ